MIALPAPPEPPDDGPKARSACVVVGASPAQVAALADSDRIAIRANRHGTLVTGILGSLPIDYAEAFAGPIYDVLYNRPGQEAGYPRIPDILGESTPEAILAALDVDAASIGYLPPSDQPRTNS